MKAFLLVGFIFSAFLLFLGITSKGTAGDVLADAVIVGGILILLFVVVVWIISFIKENREKGADR